MVHVQGAKGGASSLSNNRIGGQERNECLSKVAKGGAGLPSDTSHRGLPGFGPCPKGGGLFGGSFFILYFCFENLVFLLRIGASSPRRKQGRCSKKY